MSKTDKIPSHVAIIMDGNGRWARARGLERHEGHRAGVNSLRNVIARAARNPGVRYLTLYVFSTENWGRPQEEVDMLMELLCRSIVNELDELLREQVKVVVIGERAGMSKTVVEHIELIERETAACTELTILLCINYSSRGELTRAARRLAEKGGLRRTLPRGDNSRNDSRRTLYRRNPRPRPDNPHRRRTASEQLPALAGSIQRTLLHPDILARFQRRRFRCGCRSVFRPSSEIRESR